MTGIPMGAVPVRTDFEMTDTKVPLGGKITAPGVSIDCNVATPETVLHGLEKWLEFLQTTGAAHDCYEAAQAKLGEAQGYLTRRHQMRLAAGQE